MPVAVGGRNGKWGVYTSQCYYEPDCAYNVVSYDDTQIVPDYRHRKIIFGHRLSQALSAHMEAGKARTKRPLCDMISA
jgi:hypothetical protein